MSKLVSTHSTTIYDFCPRGAIIAFPVVAIPAGWLECNGQAISRATFTDLFGLIGTTYGVGDGTTTFNLPDYRGVFLRGTDNGKGYDTGRVLGSEQGDAFQGHYHNAKTLASTPGGTTNNPAYPGGSAESGNVITAPITDGAHGIPRTASETRPRNVSVVFCIKATMAMATSDSTVATFAPLTHNTHQGEVSSLATSGYKKFADGTILQWGTYAINTATTATVTFPVAFPNSCRNVIVALAATGAYSVANADTYTATTFRMNVSAGAATLQVAWQAIGN